MTKLAIYNGRQEQWLDFRNKNQDIINKIGTPYLEKDEENNDNNKSGLKKTYNIIQILQFKSQRNIFIKLTIISTFCSYTVNIWFFICQKNLMVRPKILIFNKNIFIIYI